MAETMDASTLPMDMLGSQELDDEIQPGTANNHYALLMPIKTSTIGCLYMVKDQYQIGRAEGPHIDYALEHFTTMNKMYLKACSKNHFNISRELVRNSTVAMIIDTSFNGTFVNNEKVGKGRKRELVHNDVISVNNPANRIFVYREENHTETLPAALSAKYVVTNRTLGRGAQGEVRLIYCKETNEQHAVKIIQKKKFTASGRVQQINSEAQTMREINILQRLDHPCIVRVLDVYDEEDVCYIVMELAEAGELFDKIIQGPSGLGEDVCKLYAYQMLKAVQYLHSKKVSHRDLKPENVLLCTDGDDTLVKITDFGLSKVLDSETMLKTYCGTPNYLAPEIVVTSGAGTYTQAVDIWSLGVILFVSLCGEQPEFEEPALVGYPPFSKDYGDMPLDKQIVKGRLIFSSKWKRVSDQARDLVQRMLTVVPNQRISAAEALEHPWLKDKQMIEKAERIMRSAQIGGKENSSGSSPKKRGRALQLGEDVSMLDMEAPQVKCMKK